MSKLQDLTHSLNSLTLKNQLREQEDNLPNTRRHLIRSILVIVDTTPSMNKKDFKPSRIALTIQYLALFLKKLFDTNPITYVSLAIAQEQVCKSLCQFSTHCEGLLMTLQKIKVSNEGSFSLEKCLIQAMTLFEDVPMYSSKEILLIQSSSTTKDTGDIFQAIQYIKKAMIITNIVSLVGKASVFQKLVQSSEGKYECVPDQKHYYQVLNDFVKSPRFDVDRVSVKLFKVAFCRKQVRDQPAFCYCHMQQHYEIYICLVCLAQLCRVPSICAVCRTQIILPGDLYRHYELKVAQLSQ